MKFFELEPLNARKNGGYAATREAPVNVAPFSSRGPYRRARLVGLGLLAAIRDALGSLDRVDFIVKLLGMVNAVPNFNDSPRVINGCSDLFVEVFSEAGRHARSAVGNVMLPNQISVEIEGIVAVKA